MKAERRASAIFRSGGPRDTLRLAGLLAGLLKGGETVCLKGMIGTGKTFFVKGLALSLGSRDIPVSASFNLMKTYRAPQLSADREPKRHKPAGQRAVHIRPACRGKRAGLNIYHFDLFRVAQSELENLGLEDYLGRTDGFTAIEWAGPARHLYRRGDFLELDFRLAGGDRRTIRASAGGPSAARILRGMERLWRAKS